MQHAIDLLVCKDLLELIDNQRSKGTRKFVFCTFLRSNGIWSHKFEEIELIIETMVN